MKHTPGFPFANLAEELTTCCLTAVLFDRSRLRKVMDIDSLGYHGRYSSSPHLVTKTRWRMHRLALALCRRYQKRAEDVLDYGGLVSIVSLCTRESPALTGISQILEGTCHVGQNGGEGVCSCFLLGDSLTGSLHFSCTLSARPMSFRNTTRS